MYLLSIFFFSVKHRKKMLKRDNYIKVIKNAFSVIYNRQSAMNIDIK